MSSRDLSRHFFEEVAKRRGAAVVVDAKKEVANLEKKILTTATNSQKPKNTSEKSFHTSEGRQKHL